MSDALPSPIQRARPLNFRRYWLALYRRDPTEATRIVEEGLASWRPQHLYLRLFQPALNLSGNLFAKGAISYRDEHFVTHHTVKLMRRVRREFVPEVTTGPLALATGVGQESHLIGLRMVCDFLRSTNWRIHMLQTRERGIVGAEVKRCRPEGVLLSIGMPEGVEPARRLVADLRRQSYAGLIAVGGRAINMRPETAKEIGADLTARGPVELIRALRKRMKW